MYTLSPIYIIDTIRMKTVSILAVCIMTTHYNFEYTFIIICLNTVFTLNSSSWCINIIMKYPVISVTHYISIIIFFLTLSPYIIRR